MFQKLKKIRSEQIVVMHDFFIDRIVRLNDLNSLVSAINEKMKVGGGSIRGIEQEEIKGGNAVNVAYSLGKLGAKVSLITVADDLGKNIIENAFSFTNKRLFISNGKPGYTVSLEIGNKRINVMVSDVGDTKNFGSEKLRKKELDAIKNASAIVVTNWASNEKGTELAVKAFETSKDALCFLDPADISTRKDEFRQCLYKLSDTLDVLSINENECRFTMKSLNLSPLPTNYTALDIATAAKTLSLKLPFNIDIHTPLGSATSNGKETVFAKSLKVNAAVSTGAGDAWDAADVTGYLCGLDANERLTFANALGAFYVSRVESPAMQELAEFLKSIEK